jgi:hypothetical protein
MDYWKLYAENLVSSLTANVNITKFTKNSAVIGAYAEATVIELVSKMVCPNRCSTGSIIDTQQVSDKDIKQLDCIIWSPTPNPAIFDTSGFALVPSQSVHGVIEVKRSAYPGVGAKISETLNWVEAKFLGTHELKPEIKKKIELEGNAYLATLVGSLPQGILEEDPHHLGLGVICVREKNNKDIELDKLLDAGRAIVLMEMDVDGTLNINASHVMHLLEFIKIVRLRAGKSLQSNGVDVGGIARGLGERGLGSLSRKK